MVATDTFTKFARRMASTQGCPYMVIAETANPIQDLEPDALQMRAEAMLATVIEGLTLPPAEIERRLRELAERDTDARRIVRSSVPM